LKDNGALEAVSAVVDNGEGRVHKKYNKTTRWDVCCAIKQSQQSVMMELGGIYTSEAAEVQEFV